MKYMLDTNVLMHVVNFNPGYRRILKRMERTDKADMVLSAVSYFELTSKIIAAKLGRDKADTLAALVAQFKVVPFNSNGRDRSRAPACPSGKIGTPHRREGHHDRRTCQGARPDMRDQQPA